MGDRSGEGDMSMHGGSAADVNCSTNAIVEGSTVQGQKGNTEVEDDELHLNMTNETILRMEFETLEDAEKFYKEYARLKGFGVRLDDIYRNKHGQPQARRMVCSAQGKRDKKYIEDLERKREHRPLTRCGCPAGMRVRKKKETGKWEVFRFDDEHNHPTLGPKHIQLHICHRNVTDTDLAQVDTVQSLGTKGSQIYGCIVGQSGGYKKSDFTKKDVYNHINQECNFQRSDSVIMAALHYLQGKVDSDPMFYMKYSVDSDGRLEHLFWADGNSRIDYKCFGDVLAFDTTCKKNKYGCPLVVFSGVNHHRKTVVFGCAIIANETEESYKWLLTTLIEAMDGKQPITIVTDSDKAMRNAIKCVLPQCCHRLCAWHLEKNATSNIANPQFSKAFRDCLFGDMTIAQFELKWKAMIEQFKVGENQWVQKMYRKRIMWAAAYLRGKLFVGLRPTSLCEGMNSYIQRFVKRSRNLVEFIHHFQRWLNYLRYNELIVDFKTIHGDLVLTTALESIERSGAKVYTQEAFWIFRREIKMSGACVMADCKQHFTTKIYRVKRFMNPNIVWSVHIDRQQEVRIMCECGKLQSFGIPCQHIIFALVQEDIDSLPACLIVHRWTKNAKDVDDLLVQNEDKADELANMRFGSLIQDCQMMCNLASRSRDSFQHVRENVRKIIKDLQEQSSIVASQRNNHHNRERMLDFKIVQSKGRPTSSSCSRRKRKQIDQTSLSEQEMSSGDDINYESPNYPFGVKDDNLSGDAFDEFQSMDSAPVEGDDDETGIWSLDGRRFEDQFGECPTK